MKRFNPKPEHMFSGIVIGVCVIRVVRWMVLFM